MIIAILTEAMEVIVYVLGAAAVALILLLLSYIRKNRTDNAPGERVLEEPPAVARVAAAQVGGARRRVRNRMRDRAQEDSDEDDAQQDFEHVSLPSGKIGTKKMKKLQEKEERARQREYELQEREERKEREKQQEELRKKKEEEELADEAAKAAAEKLLQEQREKEEYEEYLKLKAQFTVEEEGTDALQCSGDEESLLKQFIQYIKDMKVVMLEDLAAHFKLKTQDVIDRIKELQENDQLSGVMDDRGKFIYITQDEYEAVAKFIKQRGRVSISELAESSNKLINLTPDNDSVHAQLVSQESG